MTIYVHSINLFLSCKHTQCGSKCIPWFLNLAWNSSFPSITGSAVNVHSLYFFPSFRRANILFRRSSSRFPFSQEENEFIKITLGIWVNIPARASQQSAVILHLLNNISFIYTSSLLLCLLSTKSRLVMERRLCCRQPSWFCRKDRKELGLL